MSERGYMSFSEPYTLSHWRAEVMGACSLASFLFAPWMAGWCAGHVVPVFSPDAFPGLAPDALPWQMASAFEQWWLMLIGAVLVACGVWGEVREWFR